MVIRQSGTSQEISKKDTLMRGYAPQPIDVLRPSEKPVVELEAKDRQQPQSYPERLDPRTKHYIERRMKQGRTKKEAIRCLKRYVAREVFAQLPRSAPAPLTIHRSIVLGYPEKLRGSLVS